MEIRFTSYQKVSTEWSRLFAFTPEVSPFLHPDAFSTAWRYFYPYYFKDCSHPLIAQFVEHGQTVALIPLVVKRKTARIFGAPNGFNECGMLFENEAIIPQCLDILRSHFRSIDLQKIDERNPLAGVRPESCRTTVNIAIPFGDNYDSYFKSLSSSVRQNIRTAYNRLNTDARQLTFKVFAANDKLCDVEPLNSAMVREIIDLYCLRHENRYGVRNTWLKKWFLKHQSFATRFYRYASNAITFYLAIDGKAAAFMSGLYIDDRIIIPRLSINEEFKRYSPGMIMICESIKYMISNTQIKVLDLSQGEEPYKYKLGGIPHLSYSFKL